MNGPSRPHPGGGESRRPCGTTTTSKFGLAVFLAACSTVCAEVESYSAGTSLETPHDQWRTTDPHMSPAQYRAASRHNQRVVLDLLEDTLASLGVSAGKLAVVSTAASLAAGDPKIRLNKMMSLQLNDATERDRSLFLNFSYSW